MEILSKDSATQQRRGKNGINKDFDPDTTLTDLSIAELAATCNSVPGERLYRAQGMIRNVERGSSITTFQLYNSNCQVDLYSSIKRINDELVEDCAMNQLVVKYDKIYRMQCLHIKKMSKLDPNHTKN